MKLYRLPYYGFFYRAIMIFVHKHNWHYAPPIYPDGDTHLWCQWCGFRQTIKFRDKSKDIIDNTLNTVGINHLSKQEGR